MDRIIVIARNDWERQLDFYVESKQGHLYRWYDRTGYLRRIKTLEPGSRDPLRGRMRELVKLAAEQAYLTKLTYVLFEPIFKIREG